MPQLRAIVQRNREKEQKQQHINGTENILLKDCTTTGAQNDHQMSGKPYGGTAALLTSEHVVLLTATFHPQIGRKIGPKSCIKNVRVIQPIRQLGGCEVACPPRKLEVVEQSVSRQELEQLMAKLEQDNRILAELDKKRNILESYSTSLSSKSSSFLAANSFAGHHSIMPSPSPSLGSLRDPSASLALQGLTASASSASLHHALVPAGHTLIPTALLHRLAPAAAADGQH
ncbi:uncharacterized protein TNCV_4652641 [Trichonephila clavipes]|nr:uncharacterized protein TNCV_4652641 [Trichonephila clavipes]